MKGDFSRLVAPPLQTVAPLLQQGRVLLDADFNEYVAAAAELLATVIADVIGTNGAPVAAPLTVSADDKGALSITAGRYYAAGMLCVNPVAVPFAEQPFLPDPTIPPEDGAYSALLRVWQRTVNWVQDPASREIALAGLDTTTREQNVWQIVIGSADPISTVVATMQARALPPVTVGNYFYRVEIHAAAAGKVTPATFKWSRTNGSSIAKIVSLDVQAGTTLVAVVQGAGVDPSTVLSPGQWVEYVDDVIDLQQQSFPLWEVTTVESLDATSARVTLTASDSRRPFDANLHPFLRAWDQQPSASVTLVDGAVPITTGQWIALESGIEVSFPLDAAVYQPGDYWQFASRSALESGIEWPPDVKGEPAAQPKTGIDVSTFPLAKLTLDGGKWTASSLVKTFAPLLGKPPASPRK